MPASALSEGTADSPDLGVMRADDEVITEKVGRARECRLGPAQLLDAARWIEEYRRAWQGRLDRLGAYVEQANAERR